MVRECPSQPSLPIPRSPSSPGSAILSQADGDPRQFSLDEMIACVRREIALRRRVYRARSTSLKPQKAGYEIGCMQAIHNLLMRLRAHDQNPQRKGLPSN